MTTDIYILYYLGMRIQVHVRIQVRVRIHARENKERIADSTKYSSVP